MNEICKMLGKKEKSLIIWTRSLEDWEQDQVILSGLEDRVIRLPCLSVKKLIPSSYDFERLAFVKKKAVVFTSKRCVDFALEYEQLRLFLEGARIFCLGRKTAECIRSYGFECEFFPEARTVEDLHAILQVRLNRDCLVLLPGPKKRAFDLHSSLQKQGYISCPLDIYETVVQLTWSDGRIPNSYEQAALISSLNGIVCFASPSACDGFANFLHPERNRLKEMLTVMALGPTTANKCKNYFRNVKTAQENDLSKLVGELS